jgi:hypothetical protein
VSLSYYILFDNMTPEQQQQVLRSLECDGHSWRDYVLVGDPPVICCGGRQGMAALLIEDNQLHAASIRFLREGGAKCFASTSEAQQFFGCDGVVKPVSL